MRNNCEWKLIVEGSTFLRPVTYNTCRTGVWAVLYAQGKD